jgi:catechol 2,3-dioxygenase-like lactoylglutathione lyase family enzyme
MTVANGTLGHIVLNVADLKKSERFYRSILGLKVSARNLETKMTFMSYGREHHDIALQALPKGTKHVSGEGMAKLHHFCIYVDRNEIIDELYPILKRRKIPIVSGPETLVVAGNRSISFLDPDGNRVEIACNANKFKFDSRKQPSAAAPQPKKKRHLTAKSLARQSRNRRFGTGEINRKGRKGRKKSPNRRGGF